MSWDLPFLRWKRNCCPLSFVALCVSVVIASTFGNSSRAYPFKFLLNDEAFFYEFHAYTIVAQILPGPDIFRKLMIYILLVKWRRYKNESWTVSRTFYNRMLLQPDGNVPPVANTILVFIYNCDSH